jgi:hypothetical protein
MGTNISEEPPDSASCDVPPKYWYPHSKPQHSIVTQKTTVITNVFLTESYRAVFMYGELEICRLETHDYLKYCPGMHWDDVNILMLMFHLLQFISCTTPCLVNVKLYAERIK